MMAFNQERVIEDMQLLMQQQAQNQIEREGQQITAVAGAGI
jgi:hypothetical protein